MNALARGFSSGSLPANPQLKQWLSFDREGLVTLKVGKVEIGQGITTALQQIAADELDLRIDQVHMASVSTDDSPDEGVTSGSYSVQHSGAAVRQACATLRALAVAAFCERFGEEAQSVRVQEGRVHSTASVHHSSYWELDMHPLLEQAVSADATPKQHAQLTLVGRSVPRTDLARKVFGQPAFIHDLVLPQMLHGRVVRVPNPAARLRSVDEESFRSAWPGVMLVRDGSFLAVLAEREETAVRAAARLAVLAQWELPASLPDAAALPGFLRQTPSEARTVAKLGPVHDALDGRAGARVFEAGYLRPFLAHASIGPSCALAHWTDDCLEVWTHSQGIFNVRAELAVFVQREFAGRALPRIVVHHAEGSGCYGHNPADDVAFDAVLLARAARGRPVRVLWTRADELGCGPFGPAHLVELRAVVSPAGALLALDQTIWSNGYTARPGRAAPGTLSFLAASALEDGFAAPVSLDPPASVGGGADRNAVPLYDIGRVNVTAHRLLEMPLRTSAIRALGGYTNIFALESFLDEIAADTGQDPIALRLNHLNDPRAHEVIRRAVGAAPWWSGEREEGVGHGFAYARYKNTGAWCAVALRIRAAETIQVLDVSAAVDVGLVVNPDGVRNQIEGGVVQSCSWTLKEAVRFSRTEVTTRSWGDYSILGFSDAPRVEVALVERPSEPSVGAGEAAQGPTAAAIGNAVAHALGVRIRELPITFERVLSALASD
ncbi:molybdopterin cofactor-binding domain-containing protein [Variovorax sp. KK3]|uniref:xanthine dehydrogenase family protein molybdopterin-binding subunit n=1 Tax=Variovorax sp. KK3 TaxID=1855728 RepID=UPI00097BB38C|nr:molybdopterin cofactor-binding domain-containing protein [Variovorax sp. KK3]